MVDGAPGHSAVSYESLIGQTIDDRYEIRELLGEGGMGAVFVARQLRLGKDVAFKVISPEVAESDTGAARFAREAMVTAKIDNPHVVSAIDYGTLPDGSAYLVLQLARGDCLVDWLPEVGARPWKWVAEVAAQLADALAVAHKLGVIHRDLKPDNIIVNNRDDGTPHVYVLDFGLAGVSEQKGARPQGTAFQPLTRAGAVLGTPGYMSPQQLAGDAVDHRADLYSLGVIMWECLSGRALWNAETFSETFALQLAEDAPPVVRDGEGAPIPKELTELIVSLLSRLPGGRPEDAERVRTALRQCLDSASESQSGLARQPSGGPATVPGNDTDPGSISSSMKDPTTRRALIVLAVLTLLVLAAIAPLAWILSKTADGAEPRPSPAAATGADLDEPAPARADGPAGEGEDAEPEGDAAPPTAARLEPPPALTKHYATMTRNKSEKKRASAAETILAHEPLAEVPAYMRLGAQLELAQGCVGKLPFVKQLGELGDARGLPTLKRLDGLSTKRCGPFKGDCYGCLRKDLAVAIEALQGAK